MTYNDFLASGYISRSEMYIFERNLFKKSMSRHFKNSEYIHMDSKYS